MEQVIKTYKVKTTDGKTHTVKCTWSEQNTVVLVFYNGEPCKTRDMVATFPVHSVVSVVS